MPTVATTTESAVMGGPLEMDGQRRPPEAFLGTNLPAAVVPPPQKTSQGWRRRRRWVVSSPPPTCNRVVPVPTDGGVAGTAAAVEVEGPYRLSPQRQMQFLEQQREQE